MIGEWDAALGDTLHERYRITGRLGSGGMGLVMEAQDLKLGRTVAIKLLREDLSIEGTGVATRANRRATNEAIAIASVKSDHIVQVFDVGCDPRGAVYVVMEHLEGCSLAQHLDRVIMQNGSVPIIEAIGWVLEACEGLAQLHRVGIVHRDVKPSNMFLERRPDGVSRIKLLDFGIAKVPGELRGDEATLTRDGQFVGSLAYTAPEQLIDARQVDVRADIWSLGVVLYELLAGQRPFQGTSDALQRAIAEESHVPLERLRPDAPEEIARAVDRCLEKDKRLRFTQLDELAVALAPFGPPSRSVDAISKLLSDAPKLRARRAPTTLDAQDSPGASAFAARSARTPEGLARAPRRWGAGVAVVLVLGAAGAFWLGRTSGRSPGPAPAMTPSAEATAQCAEAAPICERMSVVAPLMPRDMTAPSEPAPSTRTRRSSELPRRARHRGAAAAAKLPAESSPPRAAPTPSAKPRPTQLWRADPFADVSALVPEPTFPRELPSATRGVRRD